MKKKLLKILGLVAAFRVLMPLHADVYNSACESSALWLEADYLYWQIQDSPKVIPLTIRQPVVDGPFSVVLGGKKIKNDWHSGGRFALGYWFDACENLGIEALYFFLGRNSKNSHVSSDENGSPRLQIPYFNVTTGQSDASALSTPGLYRGTAALKTSNKMQGAELNLLKRFDLRNATLSMFAGFRYWNFEDNLTFAVNSPLVVSPTVYNYKDTFHTQNNFYGAQIGGRLKQCFASFIVDMTGKVAVGAMCQQSKIRGVFHTNEFIGSIQTFEGGFFALPTNISHHKKTRLSVIPELNLNVGYPLTHNANIHVGYSVLYATEVLRASKQMNRRLNPTQSANIEFTPTPVLVGEASPKPKLKTTSLWAQGVNVGLDFRF